MVLRKSDPRPAAVYRWYAFTGRLLYIGCALDPDKRWNEIKLAEDWPRLAARRTVTWYETAGEALQAELDAIRTESPLLNLQGNRGRKLHARVYRHLQLADGGVLRLLRGHDKWHVGEDAIAAYEREMAAAAARYVRAHPFRRMWEVAQHEEPVELIRRAAAR
jgi:hypothetical protein